MNKLIPLGVIAAFTTLTGCTPESDNGTVVIDPVTGTPITAPEPTIGYPINPKDPEAPLLQPILSDWEQIKEILYGFGFNDDEITQVCPQTSNEFCYLAEQESGFKQVGYFKHSKAYSKELTAYRVIRHGSYINTIIGEPKFTVGGVTEIEFINGAFAVAPLQQAGQTHWAALEDISIDTNFEELESGQHHTFHFQASFDQDVMTREQFIEDANNDTSAYMFTTSFDYEFNGSGDGVNLSNALVKASENLALIIEKTW